MNIERIKFMLDWMKDQEEYVQFFGDEKNPERYRVWLFRNVSVREAHIIKFSDLELDKHYQFILHAIEMKHSELSIEDRFNLEWERFISRLEAK